LKRSVESPFDEKTRFGLYLDTLHTLYPYPKKNQEEKDKVLDSYWLVLKKTHFNLTMDNYSDLYDIVAMENDKWFPTFQILKRVANVFNTQYSDRKEEQLIDPTKIEDCDIDLLSYYEIPPDEARSIMLTILTPKLPRERVEKFLTTYSLIFRQFIKDDYKHFYKCVKRLDSKDINGGSILRFFANMRTERVQPRLEKITKFGLKHDWFKKPPQEVVDAMNTIRKAYVGKKDWEICG